MSPRLPDGTAAAEADLDHGELDAGLAKGVEGRDGEALEEGEIRPAAIEHGAERALEADVVDRLAAEADALGEPAEVRRGVEASAQAGGARDGLDHR